MASNQTIAITFGSSAVVIIAAVMIIAHCGILPSTCTHSQQPIQISFDSKSYIPGSIATITLKTNSSFQLSNPMVLITSSDNNTKEIPLTLINSTLANTTVTLKSNGCAKNDYSCLIVNKGDNLYIMYTNPSSGKYVYDGAVILSDGQVSFSPNHNFITGESFNVIVYDPSKSGNGSNPGTVLVNINSSNSEHSKSEDMDLTLTERKNPVNGKYDTGIFSNLWEVTLAKYTNSSIPIINASSGNTLVVKYENSQDSASVNNIKSSAAGYGYANNIESFNQTPAPANKKIDCASISSDVDYDGICDSWESSGSGLSVDVPGFQTFTYSACKSTNLLDPLCPVVGNKDVFILVDALPGMIPNSASQVAFQDVVNVFNGINLGGNNNPKLHVLLWGAPNYTTGTFITTGVSGKAGCDLMHLDFPNDIDTLKLNNFLNDNQNPPHVAQSQVLHYALLGWKICSPYSTTSGFAEYKGNDLVITLGNFGEKTANPDSAHALYPVHALEGTFMHELGHNLGLYHGGNDNLNCKPNYLSVMSYSRQITDAMNWPTSGVSSTLNYSGESMNSIDEKGPRDDINLGPINRAASATVFGNHLGLNSYSWQLPVWHRLQNFIDADNNPVTTLDPPTDLNKITSDYAQGNVSTACGADDSPTGTVLSGFNDWSHLFYQFRSSSNFDAGYGIDYTEDAREMNSTDYNRFIFQNLWALKNEFNSTGISGGNLTKIDNIIDLSGISILNGDYSFAYGNMSILKNMCHGIVNDKPTALWLCDRLTTDQATHLKANLLPTIPEAPQNLTGFHHYVKGTLLTNEIDLQWLPPQYTSSYDIDNYKIEKSEADSPYQIINYTNATQYVDTTFKDNTAYSYRVTAQNKAGFGPYVQVNVTTGNIAYKANYALNTTIPQIKEKIKELSNPDPEIPIQITDVENKLKLAPTQETEKNAKYLLDLDKQIQLIYDKIQKSYYESQKKQSTNKRQYSNP